MSFIHWLDYPPADADTFDLQQPVAGWVSSTLPIHRIEIHSLARVDAQVRRTPRPDVENQNRGSFAHHAGFVSSVSVADWLQGRERVELRLRVYAGPESVEEAVFPLAFVTPLARKQRKLERFQGLLACPECLSPLRAQPPVFQCSRCASVYRHNGNSVDFLTEEFKRQFAIVPTGNVSSWNYDPRILQILREHPDQLFLDCGAGCRNKTFDNVINLEIVDYPSTDVLAVGERLPFAADSLDGVFSVAVLEHVKDPFRCAREIQRVLKPGGVLYCAAAFLQPVHAYPHHYYNMTALGLENLFAGMDIVEREVPLSLHPIKALAWMLRAYVEGLPAGWRKPFMKMQVADVLSLEQPPHLHGHPLVQEVSGDKRFELACGTVVVARKR